jgi:hypothetical protein
VGGDDTFFFPEFIVDDDNDDDAVDFDAGVLVRRLMKNRSLLQ